MADQNLKRIFREAAEIAAGVPEGLRDVAFTRALDALMGEVPRPVATSAPKGRGKGRPPEDAKAGPGAFSRLMDVTNTEAVLQKSLDVLNVATGVLGKKEMTARELAKALDESFGVAATSEVVSQVLEGAGQAVRGVRRGGETFYRLLQPDTAKKSKKGKKGGGKHKNKAGKKSAKKEQTEQRTAIGVVKDLLVTGFFKAARTAGETVLHLQRRGLEFTARELSAALVRLVNAGTLSRDKDGRGRYRYKSA